MRRRHAAIPHTPRCSINSRRSLKPSLLYPSCPPSQLSLTINFLTSHLSNHWLLLTLVHLHYLSVVICIRHRLHRQPSLPNTLIPLSAFLDPCILECLLYAMDWLLELPGGITDVKVQESDSVSWKWNFNQALNSLTQG